jgi:hypothetical protein
VLFNIGGLTQLLHGLGFADIRVVRRPDVRHHLAIVSERLALGQPPYDESIQVDSVRTGIVDSVREAVDPSKSDFITLTCRRSH